MIEKAKKNAQNGVKKSSREAALEILLEVAGHPEGQKPLQTLIESAARASSMEPRDRALLTELACGVMRRHVLLDVFLSRRLTRPEGLSQKIRMLLRQGLYELLFLDGIPARATVHETAAIAIRACGKGMGGLVNAVLRRLAEDSAAIAEEIAVRGRQSAGESTDPRDIAEAASIPLWLASKWIGDYGPAGASALASNASVPPSPSWRVNMARSGAEELREEWTAKGFRPVGRCGFSAHLLDPARAGAASERDALAALEAEGRISRQGVSSQILAEDIVSWLDAHAEGRPVRVWDACCGRGGKSCALLEKGVEVVLSSDPSKHRLDDFRREAGRLGLRLPEIRCAAAQDVRGSFPYVLLDAPCSGTGTIGRNPELRFRLSEEGIGNAVRLQKELLDAVWPAVGRGGALFYSTCAAGRDENELQADAFLRRHPDAEASVIRMYEPMFPGEDAMFLAVFVRR